IHERNNKGDANSIVVAAHEASHALNYSEGNTNPKLIKVLERLWWLFVGLAVIAILVDYLLFMFQGTEIPKTVIYILIAFHCISTISYLLYYMKDESLTEKRALKELQTVYQNEQISSVSFKDVEKESKHRLKIWVYLKS
ncbi:zinc metallopeptidase, partial [Escherichia coli]